MESGTVGRFRRLDIAGKGKGTEKGWDGMGLEGMGGARLLLALVEITARMAFQGSEGYLQQVFCRVPLDRPVEVD